MSTVTLACTHSPGLILVDPLSSASGRAAVSSCPGFDRVADTVQSPVTLLGKNANGSGVTPGIDAKLWARWSFVNASLVPGAVFLASTP